MPQLPHQLASLGAQIRARRRKLGLTQARLAAMTSLSRASINALEAGTTDLGLAKVIRIAQVLDLDLRLGTRVGRGKFDWVATAASSASVSYRRQMPAAVLVRAVTTGQAASSYLPHIATLLEEASPALLVRTLEEIYPAGVPREAWDTLSRLSRLTRTARPYLR